MHYLRCIIFTSITAVMLLCFTASNSFAQQCCQPSVPRLTLSNIPPLNSGMPYNTMIGYIIADSACRVSSTGIAHAINSCQNYDSLRYVLKILYCMDDYNPALFQQYLTNAYKLDTSYKTFPDNLNMAIHKAEIMLGDTGRLEISLMNATHVLHIRITSIQGDGGDSTSYWYQKCVTATVVDTFKGRTWLSCSSGNGPTVQTSTPSISFTIHPNQPCHEGNPANGWTPWNKLTNHAFDPQGNMIPDYGDLPWQVGNEYEIFLNQRMRSDSLYDYFGYAPDGLDAQGGVFPISGGNVQDSTNYFGLGTSVSVSTFENAIKQKIAQIIQ